VSRLPHRRFTCRLLATMLATMGLVAAAAPAHAATAPARPALGPTVCTEGSISDPRLTSNRFGKFVSVSASVGCNVAYSMSIDLTLVSPGGETTRHFEMTQPGQTDVTGTVSRPCSSPGWYMGRAHFHVSAPRISFDSDADSQWVLFLCGLFP